MQRWTFQTNSWEGIHGALLQDIRDELINLRGELAKANFILGGIRRNTYKPVRKKKARRR